MQLYTKYSSPHARTSRAAIAWLGVALGGALLGWLWWRGGRAPVPEPPPAQPKIVPAARPITNVPPPVQPLVTPTSDPVAPSRPPPAAQFPARTSAPARSGETVLAVQLALARQGLSSGSLDGVLGAQTRAAVRAFQQREHLPPNGEPDSVTLERLDLTPPLYTNYVVGSNDLTRLQPVSATWLGKSQQARLDYETILELVAERSQSHPDFIRRLNPGIDWSQVAAGTTLRVPNLEPPVLRAKAALVHIHLAGKTLTAFDANTNLLVHFPCSIARRVEKRPVGELHVVKVALNPSYRFDPEVFPESVEARAVGRPLMLPPGPNNPVGTAWIGLDRPGYGIHGTPRPEEVGRTESHGCFRLANWNAEILFRLVSVGTPVVVEP